jgi:hypothetical protein
MTDVKLYVKMEKIMKWYISNLKYSLFFSSVGKNLKTDFDLRKSDLKSENHPKKSKNKKWFRSKSKSQTRWFKSRFKSFSI